MDRRTVWAILLMMAIAIAPAIFMKRTQGSGNAGTRGSETAAPVDSSGVPTLRAPDSAYRAPSTDSAGAAASPLPRVPAVAPRAEGTTPGATPDTIRITSPLYTYGISSRGGTLIEATLAQYRSMARGERGRPAQLLPPDSRLLGLTVVLGRDTIPTGDWIFTASAESLDVKAPTALRLTGSRNGINLELTYTFRPDDYQIGVEGRVTGVGPNGGLVRVAMGPTIANTEADSNENHRSLALVTKHNETERTDFSGLEPGEPKSISGPLEWAAIKSKYFVTAVLALDSTRGRISGATATAPPTAGDDPIRASVDLGLPLPPSGAFGFTA
jgi:YidC/Oxa1 family membrane protein insertase